MHRIETAWAANPWGRGWPKGIGFLAFLGCSALAPCFAQETVQEAERPPTSTARGVPTVASVLETRMEGAREEFGFPACGVGFVLPDGLSGSIAVGFTDEDGTQPLTVEGRMFSGSIGKSYVGAVALCLAGSGDLDLDALVSDYLGHEEWFARIPNADTMTARMLLRHQSGVPEHVWRPEFQRAVIDEPDRPWTPRDLLEFTWDVEPLFPAGERWSYADTGYLIAGLVCEEAGGAPYYELLQQLVLDPCELRDTIPANQRRLPGLVNGFRSGIAFGEGPTLVDGQYFVNPAFEWCGGGLICTPRDLARFCKELFAGDLVPEDLREDLLDGVPAHPRVARLYGIGVFVDEGLHGPRYGHSGIMPGYTSQMAWYPDLELSLAIQFNTDGRRRIGKSHGEWLDELAGLVVDALGG